MIVVFNFKALCFLFYIKVLNSNFLVCPSDLVQQPGFEGLVKEECWCFWLGQVKMEIFSYQQISMVKFSCRAIYVCYLLRHNNKLNFHQFEYMLCKTGIIKIKNQVISWWGPSFCIYRALCIKDMTIVPLLQVLYRRKRGILDNCRLRHQVAFWSN